MKIAVLTADDVRLLLHIRDRIRLDRFGMYNLQTRQDRDAEVALLDRVIAMAEANRNGDRR